MSERCERWRGLMALEVVGALGDDDAVALLGHLDGCDECRADRESLLGLRPALSAADPGRLERPAVPAELEHAVLSQLRAEAGRDKRRRRAQVLLGAAAATLVAVAGIVTGLLVSFGPAGARTVALVGPPGVDASAQFIPEPWGTEVHLQETGQPAGQVLTVALKSRSGRWWDMGTYRTVAGHTVRVDLACAVRAQEVYALFVRDSSGRVVLRSETA